jgi:hypothetical protein
MRNLALSAIALMGLAACQQPTGITTESFSTEASPMFSQSADVCVLSAEYTLYAGQSTAMGTLDVSNDADSLRITYTADTGWSLKETHVQLSLNVPLERGAPGRYTNGNTSHIPGTTTFTYTYALADLGYSFGDVVYIRAHAATGNGETAYAGTIVKPKKGSWFGYAAFEVRKPCPTGPVCMLKDDYFGTLINNGGNEAAISHVTLVFEQTAGDTDGDGYYVVKIDGWNGTGPDFDEYVGDVLAWLVANDPNITEASLASFVGSVVKAGNNASFFAYGCYDENGITADEFPAGLNLFIINGNDRGGVIDRTHQYTTIFATPL